jgi:putative nucleotidyltransferase with HDIG domain
MYLQQFVGRRLKRDIVTRFGLILLNKHTILEAEHIPKLESHNVELTEEDVEFPEIAGQFRERLLTEATEEIRSMFLAIRLEEKVPMNEIAQRLVPAVEQAAGSNDLFDLLSSIQSKDDYTYRHNIGVGLLATMIGKWLQLPDDELRVLTMAATLHDIGKVRIPEHILNKPGKYTSEEYEIMKKHAEYGYEILLQSDCADPRIPLVALQHHEREDGGGYPYGITGKQIHFFSKIVAVADVFHAMTSHRVYRPGKSFCEVIRQLHESRFGKLDPEIIEVFLRHIMTMAIGNEVILSDGRRAKVVFIHPQDPLNPIVAVGDEYIDLRKDKQIEIAHIVG